MQFSRRQSFWLPAIPLILSNGLARAAGLDPAAVIYKLPDQIQWGPPSSAGAQNAVQRNGSPATISAVRTFTRTIGSSRCCKGRGGSVAAPNSIPMQRCRCPRAASSPISANKCISTAPRPRTPSCSLSVRGRQPQRRRKSNRTPRTARSLTGREVSGSRREKRRLRCSIFGVPICASYPADTLTSDSRC